MIHEKTRKSCLQFVALFFSYIACIPHMAFAVTADAAQMDCASYSLSRNEIARALAVARPTLPISVRLEVSFACWNPDHALAVLETSRVLTTEGVQQWWAVSCQRNESTWACDRPEFKQFIVVNLAVGDQPHAVELSFGKEIAGARARALAAQALTFYMDTGSPLRDCSTIEDSAKSPVGSHRGDKRMSAAEPFHVNVIRDGSTDSVWLNDVDVIISFDPADKWSPCWRDIEIVN